MSYGITHTEAFITEYKGYHGGEGFGGRQEIIDDIEFFNVEEGFENFIDSLITEDSFDYDSSWTFDNLTLTSKNTETGEIIDLDFPNEYLSEKDMKKIFLERVDTEKLKNLEKELNEEKKDLIKLNQRSEEKEKKEIAKIIKIISIKTKFDSKKRVIKEEIEAEEKKRENIKLQMNTFSQGDKEEYYHNYYREDNKEIDEVLEILYQTLKDLNEEEIELLKNITIDDIDIQNPDIQKKYERRKAERIENIKKIEMFLKFIATLKTKNKIEQKSIKSPS